MVELILGLLYRRACKAALSAIRLQKYRWA
jgi:hypothetical protein